VSPVTQWPAAFVTVTVSATISTPLLNVWPSACVGGEVETTPAIVRLSTVEIVFRALTMTRPYTNPR
jgi:hypothetical protein